MPSSRIPHIRHAFLEHDGEVATITAPNEEQSLTDMLHIICDGWLNWTQILDNFNRKMHDHIQLALWYILCSISIFQDKVTNHNNIYVSYLNREDMSVHLSVVSLRFELFCGLQYK